MKKESQKLDQFTNFTRISTFMAHIKIIIEQTIIKLKPSSYRLRKFTKTPQRKQSKLVFKKLYFD